MRHFLLYRADIPQSPPRPAPDSVRVSPSVIADAPKPMQILEQVNKKWYILKFSLRKTPCFNLVTTFYSCNSYISQALPMGPSTPPRDTADDPGPEQPSSGVTSQAQLAASPPRLTGSPPALTSTPPKSATNSPQPLNSIRPGILASPARPTGLSFSIKILYT